MGMNIGKRGAARNEINVTPLIDVLLVLLVIFLVVMPLLVKMETADVPKELAPDQTTDQATTVTVKLRGDLSLVVDDGEHESPVEAADLARTLRPKLEAMRATGPKLVFVDFDDAVPWNLVISTMDTIRSIAGDASHDEIKVALKVREPAR